jgi:hypothetical protein
VPYYLFKIRSRDQFELIKDLELLNVFDAFREARDAAKQLRSVQLEADAVFKVMFADNQLSAEEQLLEKRDRPVLMEHER